MRFGWAWLGVAALLIVTLWVFAILRLLTRLMKDRPTVY